MCSMLPTLESKTLKMARLSRAEKALKLLEYLPDEFFPHKWLKRSSLYIEVSEEKVKEYFDILVIGKYLRDNNSMRFYKTDKAKSGDIKLNLVDEE